MANNNEVRMKKLGNPFIKPMIFVSIICILSIAACIWSNYRLAKLSKQNKEDTKVEEKVEPKKEEEKEEPVIEETEITDETKIEVLKNKQIVLNNYTSDQIIFKRSNIYERNLNSIDLIEERKLVSVIYTLYEDKKYEELDKNKYPNIEANKDGATFIISTDLVKELYTNVYGGNLDISTTFPEGIKDSFYYNQEYNVYVVNAGFGGTCGEYTKSYDYDYKEDPTHLYVYSTFAYYECIGGNNTIYKDFMKTENYSTSDSDFVLNDSNYEQFHHYKITYLKKGDNYIFDKIEIIK
jgi:hypothetical protein